MFLLAEGRPNGESLSLKRLVVVFCSYSPKYYSNPRANRIERRWRDQLVPAPSRVRYLADNVRKDKSALTKLAVN